MGSYDGVQFKCPKCKKDTGSQTKILGDCILKEYKLGDKVNFQDCIFELKCGCEFCGQKVAVEIKSNILTKFVPFNKATIREIDWGDYEEIEAKK